MQGTTGQSNGGNVYLPLVRLARGLFWSALAVGILALLMPQVVPLWLALALALGWALTFLYGLRHVRRTRRHDLRCPFCGWIPFALNAWKCKECGFVWDTFSTDGVCPQCGHEHEEAACVRCRRISPHRRWRARNDRVD